METKSFKLYIDGETVKDKLNKDIIVHDEPKKVTSERFRILLFTTEQKEKLFKDLTLKPTGKETNKKLYEMIFEKAEQKYKTKIDFIDDLYDAIGYGKFMHVDEDNVKFVDELEEYPFSIWEGEAIGDNGAGETNIYSEWYGIQIGKWPKWEWIYCKEYEEIKE